MTKIISSSFECQFFIQTMVTVWETFKNQSLCSWIAVILSKLKYKKQDKQRKSELNLTLKNNMLEMASGAEITRACRVLLHVLGIDISTP